MAAIERSQAEGEHEVVDDAGPERGWHAEGIRREDGELLEAEERLRRQHERPDLREVGVGDAEAVEQGLDLCGLFSHGGVDGERADGLRRAGALPGGSFDLYVGKEGAGDLGQERVEVCNIGRW